MSVEFNERLSSLPCGMPWGWQADLARTCGVSRTSVTGWFSGRNKSVQARYLFSIADYFGINARWLATGDGPKWVSKEEVGTG